MRIGYVCCAGCEERDTLRCCIPGEFIHVKRKILFNIDLWLQVCALVLCSLLGNGKVSGGARRGKTI